MSAQAPSRFEPLRWTFAFIGHHGALFLGLGLIAAIGRALQGGMFGEIPALASWSLELVVNGARAALFLAALGNGSLLAGWHRVRSWFAPRSPTAAADDIDWWAMTWNIALYVILAASINGIIWLVVHQTPLWPDMKSRGWVAPSADRTALTLFLKNLSVIPFTLVFLPMLLRSFAPRPTASSASQ